MAKTGDGILRLTTVQRISCGDRAFYLVEMRKSATNKLPLAPDKKLGYKDSGITAEDIINAMGRGGFSVIQLDSIEVGKAEYIRLLKGTKGNK